MNRRTFLQAGALIAGALGWVKARADVARVQELDVDLKPVSPALPDGWTRVSGYTKFPPFVYVHRSGPGACGAIAFRMWRKPAPGDMVQSRDAVHVDGRPILNGSPITCDACGRGVLLRTADIELSHAG